MLISLFLKGLVIGICVSAPLGPIGILIIQRTISKNMVSGFLSGMGATITDVFYAVIAAFSITYVIDFIQQNELMFEIIGSLVLFSLGIYIYNKNPRRDMLRYREKGYSYFHDILSTFLMTFPNPLVILIFITVFAGFGIAQEMDTPVQIGVLIFGLMLGACLWWLTLSGTVNYFRKRFSLRFIWWTNKISGALIMAMVILFALFSLL
ncbi:MAG: LysE family translocator [Bacteroidales bacterium]|jgi:threonine/homoserine/homoserine lactone efflux protein|nr:LysE family translocator [Bacteroidales bacterium]